eukprot:Sspe_Gene.52368::Locus_29026_Transcript_1_1_Confidence_1.000_Length_1347::g.52368::m.52368
MYTRTLAQSTDGWMAAWEETEALSCSGAVGHLEMAEGHPHAHRKRRGGRGEGEGRNVCVCGRVCVHHAHRAMGCPIEVTLVTGGSSKRRGTLKRMATVDPP